jgi:glycosyltransferase involved in cell wall biosynthesis
MAQIDIIIPTYNRANFIERALKSVLNQGYRDFKVYIIDDGSTDQTEDVLKPFLAQIEYIKTDNRGVSAARNLGVKVSRSPWLAFLDSDDEWLPKKLEIQMEAALKSDLPLWYCDEIWMRNGLRVNQKLKHQKSGGELFYRSLELCLIGASTVVIKRDLFQEVGLFKEEFIVCEDYDLWLRVCARYQVGFCPDALTIKHAGHGDQLSEKFKAMDYFRLRSMVELSSEIQLSDVQKLALHEAFEKKYQILNAGYIKHGRDNEWQELQKLHSKMSSYQS